MCSHSYIPLVMEPHLKEDGTICCLKTIEVTCVNCEEKRVLGAEGVVIE